MARIRTYIKPFNDDGTYASSWTEVTDDTGEDGVGSIQQRLDSNTFDVGVFTNSSLSLTLRNDHGKYSDVGQLASIFRYKRAESLVKVTWDISNWDYQGFGSHTSDVVGEEQIVFTGLLDDQGTKTTARDQKLTFTVLGRESIFDKVLVPIASLSNGDLAADVIYDLLNQAKITALATVSASNISLGSNIQIDDVSVLTNKTVKEALDELLEVTNSVLFIDANDAVKVVSRTAGASVSKTFYGQGSDNGIENILSIENDRTGVNRLFNFITWADTSLSSQNATTVTKYGYRKKEVGFDGVTNNTRRQAVLDAIKNEFGDIKREFDLRTPIAYDVLELDLLSRVSIDYPYLLVSTSDLPYYEVSEYEVAQYPKELLGFNVLPEDHFKIIGREINLQKGEVKFSMRAV